jgi:hypothetical protein
MEFGVTDRKAEMAAKRQERKRQYKIDTLKAREQELLGQIDGYIEHGKIDEAQMASEEAATTRGTYQKMEKEATTFKSVGDFAYQEHLTHSKDSKKDLKTVGKYLGKKEKEKAKLGDSQVEKIREQYRDVKQLQGEKEYAERDNAKYNATLSAKQIFNERMTAYNARQAQVRTQTASVDQQIADLQRAGGSS